MKRQQAELVEVKIPEGAVHWCSRAKKRVEGPGSVFVTATAAGTMTRLMKRNQPTAGPAADASKDQALRDALAEIEQLRRQLAATKDGKAKPGRKPKAAPTPEPAPETEG